MKNMLLIIALFISWNAIAEEKVWYCTTEKSGGLKYKGNSWQVVTFKPERMTVRQKDNILSFSDKNLRDASANCKNVVWQIIQCDGLAASFMLNAKNGLATSSYIFGWLSGEKNENGSYDTVSTTLWRCESF